MHELAVWEPRDRNRTAPARALPKVAELTTATCNNVCCQLIIQSADLPVSLQQRVHQMQQRPSGHGRLLVLVSTSACTGGHRGKFPCGNSDNSSSSFDHRLLRHLKRTTYQGTVASATGCGNCESDHPVVTVGQQGSGWVAAAQACCMCLLPGC